MKDRKPEARRGGGRPKKFLEPSRVVTLTLPDSTIEQLSDIHQDRAKAIVKAAQLVTDQQDDEVRVDLIEVAPNVAMITVPYCRYLKDSPGISLVQIVPNKFLIVLSEGTPLSAFEISVEDQLELIAGEETTDHRILEQLLGRLRSARRANRANLASVVLVDIE